MPGNETEKLLHPLVCMVQGISSAEKHNLSRRDRDAIEERVAALISSQCYIRKEYYVRSLV